MYIHTLGITFKFILANQDGQIAIKKEFVSTEFDVVYQMESG